MNDPQLGGQHACNGREPELSGLRARVKPPLIVYVDDNETGRALLARYLEMKGGYRLIGFSIGDEGLAFCQKTRPDLLITDVVHPGIDGLELCRLIRADPDLADLPLIVCTAYDGVFVGAEVDALGATYLYKPCHLDELLAVIEQAIHPGGPKSH